MGRRRRTEPLPHLEWFYATVESWEPVVSVGINRFKWELSPDHIRESTFVVVSGPIRHHSAPRGTPKRKFAILSVTLLPSPKRMTTLSESTDRIGNVWVDKGRLCASAWLSEIAFTTVAAGLAAGRFKELALCVRDFRYRKGATDEVELRCELTPEEED